MTLSSPNMQINSHNVNAHVLSSTRTLTQSIKQTQIQQAQNVTPLQKGV